MASAGGGYMYILLERIIVEKQIRTGIDMESDSFKSLVASVAARGILEPVIVVGKEDKYLLLAGERRFLACKQLGLVAIPARVLDKVSDQAEIIEIQMIENFQREDIDPIDTGNAFVDFIKVKHNNAEFSQILNNVISYGIDPGRVDNAFALTVNAIAKHAGKSIISIRNILTLLKLPKEIQDAVKKGLIGVSQGYIFAANLENPGLMEVFNTILEKPVTNAALTSMLKSYTKVKRDLSSMKPKPFAKYYPNLRAMKTAIEKGKGKFARSDLEKLLNDLRTVCALVEQQVQDAPATESSTESKPSENLA
jgi:ParB family chromosome partitioning protein